MVETSYDLIALIVSSVLISVVFIVVTIIIIVYWKRLKVGETHLCLLFVFATCLIFANFLEL